MVSGEDRIFTKYLLKKSLLDKHLLTLEIGHQGKDDNYTHGSSGDITAGTFSSYKCAVMHM